MEKIEEISKKRETVSAEKLNRVFQELEDISRRLENLEKAYTARAVKKRISSSPK